MIGAALVAARFYIPGAVMTFAAAIADCADGDLARATGRSSKIGAFVDSVLDRWTDAALILALAYSDIEELALVAGFALTGSFLTSYTRARAQSLGADCPEGVGGRDTRILILVIAIAAGMVWWGLVVVAFVGLITSVQRGVVAARRLALIEQQVGLRD